MAITGISISQDNKVGDSDLLATQSPLVFLVDVTYTGLIPDVLYCDIYDKDSELLSTFKCIPYKDLLPTIRQFMFIADGILRGYMEDFNDFVQTENSLEYVEDITKIFELKFRDPDAGVTDESITFTAIHAIRQFGENPNLSEIYNNDHDTYIAAKGKPCYVYFYNNNESNVLSIGSAGSTVKFVVSDSGGFVQNALVTISGSSKLTDINGECSFVLPNDNYSYLITKDGYADKTGNFTVSDADMTIPVTIVELVLASITFNFNFATGTFGNSEIGWATITGGVGNHILYYPKTYKDVIIIPDYCTGYKRTVMNITVPDANPININADAAQVATITFHVRDNVFDLPLSGALVIVTYNSETCIPACPLTDAGGNTSTDLYAPATPYVRTFNFTCQRVGYSDLAGSFNVTEAEGSKTINLIMSEL